MRACFVRRGATLIDVLVSLSVIALLLALLVPGTGFARERIRRVICSNNLRQWGVALHAYRQDYDDYLPTEGTYWGKLYWDGVWYNELPPYIDMPAYRDIEGVNKQIRDPDRLSAWTCPSKNLTGVYKSMSGKNQFDYAMNCVLDGMGDPDEDGSDDTPGYPDLPRGQPLPAHLFDKEPFTVFLFDVEQNSMNGSPRNVANMYQRNRDGARVGKFHGDFANVLYISGGVGHCVADDIVTDKDFEHGRIKWNTPHLYWGYPPARR